MKLATNIVAVSALIFCSAASHAATIYAQDFESGSLGAEWSGAGSIQSPQGLSAFGFGAYHLKNDGSTASLLNLSGLAAHTTVTLSFSLAQWDSVDYPGDLFQVKADGNFIINEGFGNYYPTTGNEGPGTPLTPPTDGGFSNPNYGYSYWRDSARAVSITFNHSASNLSLSFQFPFSQGSPDESFGIDNVSISTNANPVPVPAALWMFVTGFVGLFGVSKVQRKSTSA